MATPSQDLICCKGCGDQSAPHHKNKLFCHACVKKRQVDYQRKYRERERANPRMVACKGCSKPFDASKTGRTWRCPDCTLAYMQEYRRKDRARHAQYSRNYRARLGDAYGERVVKRRADLIGKMTPIELAAFRKREADKSRQMTAVLRAQVFAAYGGYRCGCCGETEPLFLTIDHVENDGARMRADKTHGRGGTQFYQWLRINNFPRGFQVLCVNCNIGKHRNGGVCPHKSGKV
jgi:DNA-directed RNA polymerase subunit RPC12/RpoP